MSKSKIVITAGLQVNGHEGSVEAIKADLKKVAKQLNEKKALKIQCHIDNSSKNIKVLQDQLNEVSQKLSLNISNVKVGDIDIGSVQESINKQLQNQSVTVKANLDTTNVSRQTKQLQNEIKNATDTGIAINKNRFDLNQYPNKIPNTRNTNNTLEVAKNVINASLKDTGDVAERVRWAQEDSSGNLQKFIVQVKKSSGAVETLTYSLNKEANAFEYLSKTIREADSSTAFRRKSIDVQKQIQSSNLDKVVSVLKTAEIYTGNLETKISDLRDELNKVEDTNGMNQFLDNFDILKAEISATKSEADYLRKEIQELDRAEKNFKSTNNSLHSNINTSINKLDSQSRNTTFRNNADNTDVSAKLAQIESLRLKYQSLLQALDEASTPEALVSIKEELDKLNPELDTTIRSSKELQDALKKNSFDASHINKVQKLADDMDKFAKANKRAIESTKQMSNGMTFADKWNELTLRMAKAADLSEDEIKHLREEIAIFGQEAENAGLKGENAFGRFLNGFKQMTTYISAQAVWGFAKRQVSEMIQEVIALDSSIVELKKVTDENAQSYERFLQSAKKQSKDLHTTTSDIVSQTAEWSKLGYSLKDAQSLATTSMIYSKVGEVDNTTAVEDLVATMKAFNIEGENSIEIVNRLNKLGNEFSTDARELGAGLKVSASTLAMAGNNISQTLAMLTGGTEITQNAQEMGTALRTISLRLRGMKGELEDLGEETEGIESISKIQTQILNLTNKRVNIFKDDGEFKSTYEILKEISKVYSDLSSTSKASLTEIMFGKTRANQGTAIIQAFQSGQIEKAYEAAENSANSAQEEFDKLSKGINSHIADFKNAYEALSTTIVKDGLIKFVVDSGATILNTLTAIIDKFGTFPTLLASIGAVGSFNKIGFFKVIEDDAAKGGNAVALFGKKLKDVIKDYQEADAGKIGENKFSQAFSGIIGFNQSDLSAIEKYNSLIESGVDKTEAFEMSMVGASNGAKSFVQSSKTATVGITGLSISEKAATITTEALGVALNTFLSFGIGLLIQAIITGITKLANAEKEAEEKAREMQEQAAETARNYLEEKQSLVELTNEYASLATTTSDLTSQKQKLLDIQDKMNEGIATQTDKVDLLNKSLAENLRLTAEQEYKDAQKIISENQTEAGTEHIEAYYTKEAKKVQDEIEREFLDILNAEHGDIAVVNGDYWYAKGWTLEERVENYQAIINLYSEWEGRNNDILDQMNAIQRNAEKIYEDQTKTNEAYNKAVKIVEDYDKAYNSDLGSRVGKILESARDLSVVLSESDSTVEKYDVFQNIEELESQARNLAGTNEVLRQQVDSVFNAINAGSQTAIKSVGDLDTAWFDTLSEMDKGALANIDKMDKAFQTLVNGNNLSHADFWDLAKFDTDKILSDIQIVNGEYKISQEQLIKLKENYINKQVESLKLAQKQSESEAQQARQSINKIQAQIDKLGEYNELKYGSANLNNPAYREHIEKYDSLNNQLETAKDNLKEYTEIWNRNNLLIKEYLSRLSSCVDNIRAMADSYVNGLKNAIDQNIKQEESRKKSLEDERQALQDQLNILEEQQKAIESQINNYKAVADVVEKEIEKQTEALKEQQKIEEDKIQAKIDAIKESREQQEAENELLEKELTVQEKLRDLEKAKQNKVVTYTEAGGFRYGVNKDAVANAEKAVKDAQNAYAKQQDEQQIKILEAEKKTISNNYEERIKEYEEYTEEWKSILEEQTNAENDRLAEEILGVEWREKIKKRDTNILNGFKSDFRNYNNQLNSLVNGEIASLKKSIEAKEDEIKAIDKTINKWNEYKAKVDDYVTSMKNQYEAEKNGLSDMAYTDSLTLDNMENKMYDFKETYKGYLQEIIDKEYELKEGMDSDIDVGWIVDGMDKIRISLEQWQDTLEELKRYNLHIHSESDAAYNRGEHITSMNWEGAAEGGSFNYTGSLNIHGTKQKSEVMFNAEQGRRLYDMVRGGTFSNLVAEKAIDAFKIAQNKSSMINNNHASSIVFSGTTINLPNVQNPEQFAKQFERYIQTTLTESQIIPPRA